MGNITFNPVGPKKSANLSINAELLQQAKQLISIFRKRWSTSGRNCPPSARDQWLAENKDALAEYNRRMNRAAYSATDCGGLMA